MVSRAIIVCVLVCIPLYARSELWQTDCEVSSNCQMVLADSGRCALRYYQFDHQIGVCRSFVLYFFWTRTGGRVVVFDEPNTFTIAYKSRRVSDSLGLTTASLVPDSLSGVVPKVLHDRFYKGPIIVKCRHMWTDQGCELPEILDADTVRAGTR